MHRTQVGQVYERDFDFILRWQQEKGSLLNKWVGSTRYLYDHQYVLNFLVDFRKAGQNTIPGPEFFIFFTLILNKLFDVAWIILSFKKVV